ESLINNGAYIDACNNYGFTALHHACFNGNADVVSLLLRKGADVEYR
uniref:Ankyrin n=1 Tax=Romanomermis culicivorax TaxID=13658 RepID=A0A915JUS2_ROMCU